MTFESCQPKLGKSLATTEESFIPRDLILGTAGNIDHGKTSLVKALTGIDCDRLPEEMSPQKESARAAKKP